ncbi:hypothetical protein [Lactiplantibacillus plantarum]|uniref:hypothetical protein n=1 Tax=Lactiplantibacillus plantarum TaxID=1590 RepID=UPI001BAB463C|nr:hypothetical protein [Lactiplantibacillus plantarum]MBS0954996.1 hypothetical protein [Lactiplantibacillus plantarum]
MNENNNQVKEVVKENTEFKMIIEKDSFKDALRKVNNCAGKYANDKHFDLAKMTSDEQNVNLYVYDGECYLRILISDAKVMGNNISCAFEPKLLLSALNGLRKGKIELVIDDNTISITEKVGKTTKNVRHVSLPVLSGDQVVEGNLQKNENNHLITKPMQFSKFIDCFRRATICSSSDESMPIIQGVHMLVMGEQLYLESTDRHLACRLITEFDSDSIACVDSENNAISGDNSEFNEFTLIIKSNYFSKMNKIFNDDDIVLAEIYDNGIRVISNSEKSCTFATTSLTGSFPKMDHFFEVEMAEAQVTCSYSALKEAVTTFTRTTQLNKGTEVVLIFNKNNLTLKTIANAEIQYSLDLEISSNLEETKICVSSAYLSNILDCLNTSELSLLIKQANAPIYFWGSKNDCALLTPMLIKE